MKKLPPLKALQAFESAGRHLSFTLAAKELNVTPGAISQQIRQLEEFFEVKLFNRLNRTIVLSDGGQLLLPAIGNGFQQLREGVNLLQQRAGGGPLTITSAPSFISKWLIPRLSRFKARHPQIDVRIDTSDRLVDFSREDIDVGIRFGDGQYPELETIFLFSFDLIAVCSPELLRQGQELKKVSDLKNFTLLHSNHDELDPGWPDWAMWLKVVDAGRSRCQSRYLLQSIGPAVPGGHRRPGRCVAGERDWRIPRWPPGGWCSPSARACRCN